MADLHPEVLKMIEAGPQRCSTCPMCKGSGKRVSRGFTGNEATHGCRICNATGRMVETPEEFARRIAALAVEKGRESVGRAPIYTDRSSIVNAFLKAHPDVTKADGFHNHSNSGPFFWIADLSRTEDGKPATIERDDERWNYYGLEVGVARWVVQR